MALTGMSKDEIQALAYVMYGEDSTNSDFTGTIVNTCVQEAVREFCMLTNALVGSARRERPSATGGYEAFITLPTGMYRVTRVHHMRYAKAGTAWYVIRPTTTDALEIREGYGWVQDSEAISGTPAENHSWYRYGGREIGFYPPEMKATAGTIQIWGHKVPDVMAYGTTVCDVAPEFTPGVVAITNRKMAERDADGDPEGKRADRFQNVASQYLALAGYRPQDKED